MSNTISTKPGVKILFVVAIMGIIFIAPITSHRFVQKIHKI